jgi:DtxR family Mn-dependent transcriptional regulator
MSIIHLTVTEENYLKEIYSLAREGSRKIPNLQIGQRLGTNPPTVTEMLRKLADKGLIAYSRTDGASLTEDGEILALQVIRKHRLWETFLVKTLGFKWDEVHEVAEQLEHIRSQKLLDELDHFLGHPEFDPHGEPIPNALGIMPVQEAIPLSSCRPGEKVQLLSVADHRQEFLQELEEKGIQLKTTMELMGYSQDRSLISLRLENGTEMELAAAAGTSLLVNRLENQAF